MQGRGRGKLTRWCWQLVTRHGGHDQLVMTLMIDVDIADTGQCRGHSSVHLHTCTAVSQSVHYTEPPLLRPTRPALWLKLPRQLHSWNIPSFIPSTRLHSIWSRLDHSSQSVSTSRVSSVKFNACQTPLSCQLSLQCFSLVLIHQSFSTDDEDLDL